MTKKRLRIIRSGTTVDKDVTYTYGTDGKLATVLYPGASVPFTYSYNLMDQPVKMTGAPTFSGGTTVDLVKNVAYGVAGQVTSMQYMQWQDAGTPYYFTETRTYNELFQLKQQVTAGSVTAANIEYTYSTTGANNGRIVSRKNNERSGEQVSYTYDSLNRVTAASSTAGWTQAFDYDGFGNLWSQTMTGGSATPMSVNLDMLKNRINTAGWSYDLNGNTVAMPTSGGYAALEYDVDNRLTKWTGPAGEENYRYLPDNKRVWKKAPGGAETVYFYGAGGQKLITYTLQTSPVALVFQSENVYFGGKLIRANGVSVVHDRLRSVVARGDSSSSVITKHDYLPYGEEMGTATGGNVDKFGTYLRDQTTGLDYADQRYFAGTLGGRFLSADPYEASGGASEPGSWGRYAYVGGDPVNANDPTGRISCTLDGFAIACGDVPMEICNYNMSLYGGGPSSGCGFGDPGSMSPTGGGGLALEPMEVAKPAECPLWALATDYRINLKSPTAVHPYFAPDVAMKLNAVFAELNAKGIVPIIEDGFRTKSEQSARAGRYPGQAALGNSWHEVGRAIDFSRSDPNLPAIERAMEAAGFTNGRYFSRKDPGHFQLAGGAGGVSNAAVEACTREHPNGY